MKDLRVVLLFALLVACVPVLTGSGVALNFVMTALYACLLAQAWNILGGFGGQFSFGHALFFGTGAYTQVILQLQFHVNAWFALPLAMGSSALVGAWVGALSFRYGLKGSYFALVTLAFAEVFRIVALSVPFTGAGVGLMLPLQSTARAIGVNPLRVKLVATIISGALMGAGGAFYVQVFQYIDPGIAYGPHTSVEALVGAIVGGMGTLWGPVVGALALHVLADLTRNLFGELPGINMMIYGAVLVLIVMFLPRGIAGSGVSIRTAWQRWTGRPS